MTSTSVALVAKELAAALWAYNRTGPVRRLAATRLHLEPRRWSVAGVWRVLQAFVAGVGVAKTAAAAEAEFEGLLRAVGQRRLPNRAKNRSYPRAVSPRRRKFPARKRRPEPASQ